MKLKDQSCATCRYWHGDEFGDCTAPLPVSLSGWLVKLKPTFSTDGYSCPAYRKRIQRKKRGNVTPIGYGKTNIGD